MSDEPSSLILNALTTRCKRWLASATAYAIESDCADVSPLFLLKAWHEPETWKDTFPDGFGELVASCGGDLVRVRAACDSRIAALPKRTDPQAAILPDADLRRILSEAHATYLRDQALFIDCQDLLGPMRHRRDWVLNKVLEVSGVNMETLAQAIAAIHTEERRRVIDLLADTAGRRNEINDRLQCFVTEEDVKEGLERITGIRLRESTQEECRQAREIGPKLRQVIFGQDKAIDAISKCFLRRLDNPSCQLPIGALLFTGPCGTGKTALGEAVAEHAFGSERQLLRIYATSYRGPTVRADLLGGENTRGKLASFVHSERAGVILNDFADRGDFHLYDLCTEMLQKGNIMVEVTGVRIKLAKCLFIFTASTGAEHIRQRGGYGGPTVTVTDEEQVHRAVREHFKSDFVEALDEIVIFEPLEGPAAVSLLEKDVADLKGVWERHGFKLDFTDRALQWLAAKRQLLDGHAAGRTLNRTVQSLMMKAYHSSIRAVRGHSGIVDWSEDGVPGASIEAGEGALVMRDVV